MILKKKRGQEMAGSEIEEYKLAVCGRETAGM
jgi:hypothetical protein